MKKTSVISLSIVILIAVLVFANSKNENYVQKTDINSYLKNDSLFDKGKTLFKNNCSACHSMYMDRKMTAPALGGITKRRKKEWLYDYTRNSIDMYQKNDSIAIGLRNQGWGLMTSFPNLSNSDLDKIYYFVEERYKITQNGIPIPIEFGFKMSENSRAKACNHILVDKKDILKVSVSKNRFWKFSCQAEKHTNDEWKSTTLKSMFEYDNSINDLIYLITEYPAIRNSKNAEWDFE